MDKIVIEKPDKTKLEALGVNSWPIWQKGKSRFDWSYDERETCYILEGRAEVETEAGSVVEFGKGDLVIFPAGMNCVWEIKQPIKKHYNMG
ncbi:MAG: cupin domain-containing protein [Candidatus Omnitrophica bacterium]|nr:cupin domain-containing protein [Candidatus Omnitrophota bacterium]